jgi:hypothetical protein
LKKVVQGWEDTGVEEDIRIRTSGLSLLGTLFEYAAEKVSQASMHMGVQIVLLILTMEREESKAILRRAGVLVVMGLLRGVDAKGGEGAVQLGLELQREVERVVRWVQSEDEDDLVKDHAASVVEGLETLRFKKLYGDRDEGVRLGKDLGLEGGLRGLDIQPSDESGGKRKKMVIEEIE